MENVFLPSKNIDDTDDIAFVDDYIFEHCKHFFTEILSLQKPNEYEFFIRDFKRRYEGGANISDDQHITDVKKLMKYRQNPDEARRKQRAMVFGLEHFSLKNICW